MNLFIDKDGVGKQLDIQVRDIDHSYHVKSALWAAGNQSGHRSIGHTWYFSWFVVVFAMLWWQDELTRLCSLTLTRPSRCT